jgi:hypothetical protein
MLTKGAAERQKPPDQTALERTYACRDRSTGGNRAGKPRDTLDEANQERICSCAIARGYAAPTEPGEEAPNSNDLRKLPLLSPSPTTNAEPDAGRHLT